LEIWDPAGTEMKSKCVFASGKKRRRRREASKLEFNGDSIGTPTNVPDVHLPTTTAVPPVPRCGHTEETSDAR